MITSVIVTAYVLGLALFLLIARPIGLFNFQTFIMAPGYFLSLSISLMGFHLYFDGKAIHHGQYLLSPGIYALVFLFNIISVLVSLWAMVLAYRWALARPLRSYYYVDTRSVPYTVIMALLLLFTLALIGFLHSRFGFAYVTEPRRLYEITRSGFGHFYFITGITMKLCFVMALFSRFRHPLILLLLFALALATGSKSNAFVLFLIFIGHRVVFSYGNRVPAGFVVALIASTAILVISLFAMTFRSSTFASPITFAKLTTSFLNEGVNNTVLLIDKYDEVYQGYHSGSIFLENNLLTRLPRVLAPGKPVIFGSFRLADTFFHTQTAMGVGAKTFGTTGDFFADFGYGAFVLLIIQGILFYGAAGIVLARLLRIGSLERGFLHFAMLLILCNIYFAHVPPGNNLPENMAIILLIGLASGLRKVTLVPEDAPPGAPGNAGDAPAAASPGTGPA